MNTEGLCCSEVKGLAALAVKGGGTIGSMPSESVRKQGQCQGNAADSLHWAIYLTNGTLKGIFNYLSRSVLKRDCFSLPDQQE